jgi:hypothetical protein
VGIGFLGSQTGGVGTRIALQRCSPPVDVGGPHHPDSKGDTAQGGTATFGQPISCPAQDVEFTSDLNLGFSRSSRVHVREPRPTLFLLPPPITHSLAFPLLGSPTTNRGTERGCGRGGAPPTHLHPRVSTARTQLPRRASAGGERRRGRPSPSPRRASA